MNVRGFSRPDCRARAVTRNDPPPLNQNVTNPDDLLGFKVLRLGAVPPEVRRVVDFLFVELENNRWRNAQALAQRLGHECHLCALVNAADESGVVDGSKEG